MKPVTWDYVPLPIFQPFHASTARNRSAFGGYGSGKSTAGCAEVQAWGLEQPGSEFLVTRKTVPALKDTTEKIFLDLLPADFLKQCEVRRSGGHLDTIQFPTGSLYYFRGMDDWKKLRSHNLTGIFWDEADEFTREDFEGMQSRIRQTRPTPKARALGYGSITRRGNILASNPQGHNWIWEMSVSERRKANFEYFIGTSFDNPYLPVDYLEDLLSMPDPWVRRYVLCSFDEFAGAIYPDWGWDTHVIDSFKRSDGRYHYDPAGWFRMGFDPGTHAGNAGVWCYYDRATHRVIAVAEYNETELAVSKHTAAWRKIEALHGMRVRQRLADPKAVGIRDRGSNISLREQYARKGFHFQLGPGNVDDRVTVLGELIFQKRFVVTRDCPRLYEQILNYRWEDLTPHQIATGRAAKPLKKDVDLVDAAQYAVSNYTPPPKVMAKEAPEDAHTREIHAAIRKQINGKRKRRSTQRHDLGGIRV